MTLHYVNHETVVCQIVCKILGTGSIFCVFRFCRKPLQSFDRSEPPLFAFMHYYSNKEIIKKTVEKHPCCHCCASFSTTDVEWREETERCRCLFQ